MREWLLRRRQPERVSVDGLTIHLDSNDWSSLWRKGIYEPGTTHLVARKLKEGETFIDVGASIGYFTLLASKLVGPRGKVIAFEPSPSTFAILKRNVEENGLKNVTIEQKAVSDVGGHVELFQARPGVYRSPRVGGRVVVDSTRLDDTIDSADFIKMDVDGHEIRAIRGMTRLLSGDVKMVVEYWPRGLSYMKSKQIDFLGPLDSLGFSFSSILDDGTQLLTSLSQLLAWGEAQARTATRRNFLDSRNVYLEKKPVTPRE